VVGTLPQSGGVQDAETLQEIAADIKLALAIRQVQLMADKEQFEADDLSPWKEQPRLIQ